MNRTIGLIRRFQDFIGRICQVVLTQRFANIDAARCQKCVSHAAADDQMIHFFDHLPQNIKFAGNFCTANNRNNRMLGIAERLVKRT